MTEPEATRSVEADLTAWGKTVVLETVGRASGRARRVTLGFIEESHETILVAASDDTTQWALNLVAEPHCHIERDGSRRAGRAVLLPPEERNAVVAGLILKYGTPSERLGRGPAFRVALVAGD